MKVLPAQEAIEKFRQAGESYKVEIIEDLIKNEGVKTVSTYSCGDFTDLCRGPHVFSTSKIKAFKLLDVAGAYWRGDEKNQMLQRVYGTAFDSKDQLKEHLHRLEEAKKRDHRRLGKELDLFSFHDEGGPGLVYWHPKGAMIRYLMEEFWKKEHLKEGATSSVSLPTLPGRFCGKRRGTLGFTRRTCIPPSTSTARNIC